MNCDNRLYLQIIPPEKNAQQFNKTLKINTQMCVHKKKKSSLYETKPELLDSSHSPLKVWVLNIDKSISRNNKHTEEPISYKFVSA